MYVSRVPLLAPIREGGRVPVKFRPLGSFSLQRGVFVLLVAAVSTVSAVIPERKEGKIQLTRSSTAWTNLLFQSFRLQL